MNHLEYQFEISENFVEYLATGTCVVSSRSRVDQVSFVEYMKALLCVVTFNFQEFRRSTRRSYFVIQVDPNGWKYDWVNQGMGSRLYFVKFLVTKRSVRYIVSFEKVKILRFILDGKESKCNEYDAQIGVLGNVVEAFMSSLKKVSKSQIFKI